MCEHSFHLKVRLVLCTRHHPIIIFPMPALVSVIIPVYNAAAYIEKTLCTVFAQTRQPIEVICVDNNSTDSSLQIIQNLQAKNQWPVMLLEEGRQGAPFARNTGLARASGDFIQFLDADDYLVPDKIEKQLSQLLHTDADFITAEHFEITDSGQRHKKRAFINSWQGLITGAIGITSSALFKKSALVSVDGFNTELKSNQEKDLYFRLLQAGFQHLQIPEPVFEKNFNTDSISNKTDRQAHTITKIVFLRSIHAFLKQHKQYGDLKKILNTADVKLYRKLCDHTTAKEIAVIQHYYSWNFVPRVWQSNNSLRTKILLSAYSPAGYFLLYRSRHRR